MVLERRDVARPLDVTTDQVAARRLVERATASGEQPGVRDLVVDHRLRIRPVDGGGRDERPEGVGR
jgi:hypothetical protein